MSNADSPFNPSPALINSWLLQARDRQRQGNLVEAQALCQQILTIQPNHVETLNLLGMLLQQRGQWTQAEQTIGTTQEIVQLHKDKRILVSDVLSHHVVKAVGQLIFGEASEPSGPVLWLNHDLVARRLIAASGGSAD